MAVYKDPPGPDDPPQRYLCPECGFLAATPMGAEIHREGCRAVSRVPAEKVLALRVAGKLRQAALFWENGAKVTALEVLDEARALMEEEAGGGTHGNDEDGPPGPDHVE